MSDEPKAPPPVAFGESAFLMTCGGVVFSADLAVKIGELLCEAHRGKEKLERQKPLTAVDKGTYWRVEGSLNRDRKVEGPGAFFVSIEKYDGRVTDIGKWWSLHPHPSVIPIIEAHLRGKKPDDTE